MARWHCAVLDCTDPDGESDDPVKAFARHRMFHHGQDGMGLHVDLTGRDEPAADHGASPPTASS